MAQLLFSQPGLQIVKNDKNGFVVATLHHTADSTKRGEAWRAEAAQGLSKAKFAMEYDISYDAMLGEKVWPEIRSRRDEIVIRESPFMNGDWPADLTMWGGFDYGQRNPSSFHVYTIHDGVTYAIWELFKPCKNIIEFARELKECPYWDQVKYIMADPDLWSLKSRNMVTGNTASPYQHFVELGVSKFVQGINDESGWLAAMQQHWLGENVTFKILASCPKMIEEFEGATYVSMSDRQLETSDYREALVDRRNHALDDCKYFMNARLQPRQSRKPLPSIVSLYSPWQHEQSIATQRRPEYN